MKNELTDRQRLLNTFGRKKIDRLVFSPRLYYWYNNNKLYLKPKREKKSPVNIPSNYIGKSQIEIYDYLGASPRYVFETFYIPLFRETIKRESNINIRVKRGEKKTELITFYKTPLGILKKVSNDGHLTEYPIKNLDDIKIMKYILKHTKFEFLHERFKEAEIKLGERGVPCTFFPRSPYMRLIVDYMGFSRTIIFLKRYASQMENFMSFISEWDDQMYELLAKSPLKIVNFGENIDANLSPPRNFEKYLIPYYEKRVKQFHQAGKYCHIHMDGSLKDLLPYLADLPFDGLEALTPQPQGDVTLKELRDAIGNKIFLDGIPSIIFLPQYSFKYIKDFTKRVLEMFSPNLIVGVSDEMPPNGEIRKLELIANIINKFNPY
ncbi:MAG: uroporphyrinogen decarboxylase family protein [Promethearchaeota archaeon]